MNRTFSIIAPHFPKFKTDDWFAWFHVKLVTLLPSFSAVMLKNATSDINCTNYHVVVSGMAKAFPSISSQGQEEITDVMVGYLKKSVSVINTPVCRQGIQSDAQWLEKNLGPFSTRAKYSDLKVFNISGVAVVENLSPKQKAELILDPDSNALENENIVREVFTSLTESPDTEQLSQFFQAYSDINKQRNITIVENPAVRDIILNLTLTALAPEFEDFGPEDYKLWFQVYLVTVMASLHPGSLAVIPSNISCASYAAMYEIIFLKSKVRHFGFCTMSKCGFRQVTKMCVFFPQTHWPRAKFENPATAAFTGCEIKQRVTQGDIRTDSFKCKETLVDEDLVCAAVDGSQLQQTVSMGISSEALCNFTITAHACSSATHLTADNLATLMKCSLESQTTYPVEVWTLLFQKASSALDQALESFATMAPNNSNPSLSHALEALGQVRIASFSQAQLQSVSFVSSWFMTNIRPFLASSSPNFLFCLSSKNFSCDTYRTVGSKQWLEANFGAYSGFATLRDLQALNPNFSSAEALSVLTPAQVAQLTLSSGALNDTDQIDHVFERLEEGNALENVDEFLEELTANGKDPDFQPAVRDHLMNRTFSIIAPHFPKFKTDDWFAWFHVKLVTLLPSFSAVMLKNATSDINCTNYHVV
ncbi:uncharacterized protein LOC127140863 [Lates calcarifer]|uniref:Uncharacterized protein LOC127140863 n=1 Tax=Lates calcarifer TaxID=8187 RepID=A0AAJ8B1P0_LATCA|nr:uncharacterized protein LOC127140863 [Lates calcarifer]